LRTHFEQAVYGSFPFWDRGYAMLARSKGCREEWLAAFRLACQRYGEPPAGSSVPPALFAIPLTRGPWMIVGVFPQGCDDRGRPGALAFHALFVGRFSYRWIGANPFAFAEALRGDWSGHDQDRPLPVGSLACPSRPGPREEARNLDPDLIRTITRAMRQGRKVVYQSSRPIDALALAVWEGLPGRIRNRASVATWAYRNENHFDLVGVPRILASDRIGPHLILGQEGTEEHA